MATDPILNKLYAVKEQLSCQFGDDLHALCEFYRQLPSWQTKVRPARGTKVAAEKLRRFTEADPILAEMYAVKEQLSKERVISGDSSAKGGKAMPVAKTAGTQKKKVRLRADAVWRQTNKKNKLR